jgi:hypothetical protein
MTPHAERVREAEQAVVAAATRFVNDAPDVSTLDVTNAVDELLALRAETCPECKGEGGEDGSIIGKCPAGCDNGRKRC